MNRPGVEDNQDVLVGDLNTILGRKDCDIIYPIENGKVTDWDMMEKIWDHCFDQGLQCDPSGQRVLLTETPKNPKLNREMMAELMFEYY